MVNVRSKLICEIDIFYADVITNSDETQTNQQLSEPRGVGDFRHTRTW